MSISADKCREYLKGYSNTKDNIIAGKSIKSSVLKQMSIGKYRIIKE